MTAPTCAATVKNLKPGHLYRLHLMITGLQATFTGFNCQHCKCLRIMNENCHCTNLIGLVEYILLITLWDIVCLFVYRFEVYAINKEGESPPVQVKNNLRPEFAKLKSWYFAPSLQWSSQMPKKSWFCGSISSMQWSLLQSEPVKAEAPYKPPSEPREPGTLYLYLYLYLVQGVSFDRFHP